MRLHHAYRIRHFTQKKNHTFHNITILCTIVLRAVDVCLMYVKTHLTGKNLMKKNVHPVNVT